MGVVLCARSSTPSSDWQSTLEAAFPGAIVETFDNLKDFQPSYQGTALPVKTDDSPSHWSAVDCQINPEVYGSALSGEENIKAISNHGEYSLGTGKSMCMSYTNFGVVDGSFPYALDRSGRYGPQRMAMFLGTVGDPTSGQNEYYVFWRQKFPWTFESLTNNGYTWTQSAHGTEEYYLNTGSPGKFNANALFINGSRISQARTQSFTLNGTAAVDNGGGTVKISPYGAGSGSLFLIAGDTITITGTINYNGTYTILASDYPAGITGQVTITHAYVAETFGSNAKAGMTLGNLGVDQWKYGDNDSLGYYTIYVRLSGANAGARNPNNAATNYIQYQSGFFSKVPDGAEFSYSGYAKTMMYSCGFNDISHWHSNPVPSMGHEQCGTEYGINGGIFCWNGSIAHYDMGIGFTRESWYGTLVDGVYDFAGFTTDITDATPDSMAAYAYNGQWITTEVRIKTGTVGNTDGEIEEWFYDESGNVLVHIATALVHNMGVIQEKFNRIEFGGNKINGGYYTQEASSWDNRWYLDDVIIHTARIGPTYFGLSGRPT